MANDNVTVKPTILKMFTILLSTKQNKTKQIPKPPNENVDEEFAWENT